VSKDVKKVFDKWLKSYDNVDPQFKKLLYDPRQANVTDVHLMMVFVYERLAEEAPAELKQETQVRLDLAEKAVRAGVSTRIKNITLYTSFASQEKKDSVVAELKGLITKIEESPLLLSKPT